MDKNTALSLAPLKKAVASLEKALAQTKDEFSRDSVIQRFEYTYELCWKSLKRYLFLNAQIEESNIKNLFREAAKLERLA
ncbi:MAG: nucleotidyltransferase substrate binding protein [Parcubacteria group bacterium]|nr:nucleotidyltransferase substrate binding protein [Parcubacteria group bacterium]